MSVRTLWIASRIWKEAPEEIAAERGLRLDQVAEALGFAEAHQNEIEASLAAEDELDCEARGSRVAA